MGLLPKVELNRNGLLVIAGIVLLVALVGAVDLVALMRVISGIVVIVTFIEIVVHLVRRRKLRIQSQSTFNAIRHPKK